MNVLSLVFGRRHFSSGVFLFRDDATGPGARTGMGLSCCRWRKNRRRKNPVVVIRQKFAGSDHPLSQKRTLKMELKIGGRTGAARKNRSQMFQGLQQGIGLHIDRRRLFAAEPGAKTIQLLTQFAPQLIDRFQRKRQPHFFSGSFEGKPRQQLHQPLPHQRSGQGVPWQNLSQDNGKSPSTTAAPSAVGTKHPPTTDHLAAGLRRIVASQNTVPVQRFNLAAAGAALLFERKSRAFNSSLSRTK
jgi:hypothetical protein